MAEVAGLVLGAVPLVISALEHYEDIIEPAKAFFQWKGQLSQMIRKLYMEHTLFEMNLELLLRRTVINDDLLEMVADPQNELWKSKELVADLKRDLGKAYNPSMDTVTEMASIMVAIAANLNIKGFEFKERIAFTMKRRAVNEKLDQLKSCNERLAVFLEKAEKIHSSTHDGDESLKARIQFVAPLPSIRANASRVHEGLHKRWCADHDCHQAGLLLEQRLIRKKRRNRRGALSDVGKRDRFGVSLWRVTVMAWLDTEFQVDDDAVAISSSHNTPKVKFSVADIAHGLNEALRSNAAEIQDICMAMEEVLHPNAGFAIDSANVMRRMYDVKSQECHLIDNHMTLSQYLPTMKRKEYVLADFYCLAITLVSSLLQLGETTWLHQAWNGENIAFIRSHQEDNLTIDIKHPYLTCLYTSDTPASAAAPYEPSPDRKNMLALAVMLLEMNCGKPIVDLRQPEDLGPNGEVNVGTDLSTARRWLDTQVRLGNLSNGFTSAITYCLQSYLDPTASLEDNHFLQSVQNRVLEPLEREMQLLLWGANV
ncbi:hypothetical protein CTAM01_00905 [Colletotrichum tamarilloi]|uniref:DUF7580 domain-containing protein n=1 Tax=Colletotrichum tamarilloi TaxID=1209934 RepID=A0ABQ9RSI0_9PEZI|nr:uncharacterized protein CTAM01_00905 [Colletotrichum tamarilloi]KAK1511975.1 hypothetical protein CTAM01_00905 [Colletotrichum tamarilloi]